jgi:UDP-N-acetylmuramyl tripeptide synthase
MTQFSLFIGKIIMKLLRATGRTGSALPGLVVERLNPNIIGKTLGKLPGGVIVISGTNGKTTTTKIIACLLEAQGLRVLTNKTGSNFVRGIVSTIVQHAHVSGKLDYDIAVFEQDEAYAVHLAKRIRPRGVVALNVMRDQMDRFGEIDTTTKLLQTLVASATDWVVLNANDERISSLTPSKGVRTFWYGHGKALQSDFLTDDQLYDADKATYHVAAKPHSELLAYGDGTVTIAQDGRKTTYDYALGGSHNAINLTAALTALAAAKPNAAPEKTVQAVSELEPAFGRGEVFTVQGGVEVTLQLVKNPAGFMHALRMVDVKPYAVAGIVINDDYADGRDVSWLWDVDFMRLQSAVKAVVTGGTRGADMALRLKYDEVKIQTITQSLPEFVKVTNGLGAELKGRVIIYCTYTAMLALREIYKQYSVDVYEVNV